MPNRPKVFFIGAGPGDPGLLTLRGAACLGRADVVVYDGLVHTARCRMLAMTDGEVFLDEPHSIGTETALGVGDVVTAYFVVNDTRYSFEATISRRRVSVMLNRTKRVAGVVITMIPCLVFYFLLQRFYVSGLQSGAVKA